jgi:5-methylcytosine-specific restriction endonuclease McrA
MLVPEHAPAHVAAASQQHEPRAKLAPLSPERFALQVTLSKETHDKLRYLQELLSHAVPKGDVAAVLDRAIDALIEKEEQRRFAACVRTRPRRSHGDGRYVPAQVRREVWQRVGGQCTFVGANGHRCESRERLEVDHVDPVAKGGRSTTANLRLCCHAHNHYAADSTFGAGFMRRKRDQKQRRSAPAAAPQTRAPRPPAEVPALDPEVIPYLRSLGFRTEEARAAAARCIAIASAPLEERVRYAISTLAPAHARRVAPGAAVNGVSVRRRMGASDVVRGAKWPRPIREQAPGRLPCSTSRHASSHS